MALHHSLWTPQRNHTGPVTDIDTVSLLTARTGPQCDYKSFESMLKNFLLKTSDIKNR
jgi:hypothetical protein